MRILVTNDDGVEAPGLRWLAQRLAEDHDVVIAAPLGDRSGSSSGLGRVTDGQVIDVRSTMVGRLPASAIDAPPALIVRAALAGLLGPPPELVLSGVNPGFNMGALLLHSGTFGAAATAAAAGAVGVAVSARDAGAHAIAAAADVASLAVAALAADPPSGVAVNLNVPEAHTGAWHVRPSLLSTELLWFDTVGSGWVLRRGSRVGPFPGGSDAAAIEAGKVGVHVQTLLAEEWDGVDRLVRFLDYYCSTARPDPCPYLRG